MALATATVVAQPPPMPPGKATDLASEGEVVAGDLGKQLDDLFAKAAGGKFAGVVLVAKGGQPLLRKGYGLAVREDQTPARPATAYCIGSITKPFTATAILRLEQMGKLKADDPLTKFFDEVPDDKKKVTLHHLMTHSAGLGEYPDKPGEGGDFAPLTKDQVVKRILEEKLRFEPGTKTAYSNNGFTLLAAVIEKASGRTYEQFLREQVFEPAGMKRTGFFGEKLWDAKLVARGYGERKLGDNQPHTWPGVTWALKGAGGIVSTVDDMHRFHQALRGDKLLTTETKARAYKVHLAEKPGGDGEGYGWIVAPTPRKTFMLNHAGGSDFGFHSIVLLYPQEDVFVAVMSNQRTPGMRDVIQGATRLALEGK
jgi:CubicO group peptidase (beta-lactamase class C family)